ncbi:MAG: hypothetical protein WEB00_11450 [Dehalococcoidia bacterium]
MATESGGTTETGGLLKEIHDRLLDQYGPQSWWPAEGPLEVIVGAILTQSAAWTNVEKALANLKGAGVLSVDGLRKVDEASLALLVFPAGYFNAKARKLKAFIEMLDREFAGDLSRLLAEPLDSLRPILLATHGIGPETADAILLYAAGQPAFVVDAYARRIFGRIGLTPSDDRYESWRRLLTQNLPHDTALMNEYHALLVTHGKELCRKREPLCPTCPLVEICQLARSRIEAAENEPRNAAYAEGRRAV